MGGSSNEPSFQAIQDGSNVAIPLTPPLTPTFCTHLHTHTHTQSLSTDQLTGLPASPFPCGFYQNICR